MCAQYALSTDGSAARVCVWAKASASQIVMGCQGLSIWDMEDSEDSHALADGPKCLSTFSECDLVLFMVIYALVSDYLSHRAHVFSGVQLSVQRVNRQDALVITTQTTEFSPLAVEVCSFFYLDGVGVGLNGNCGPYRRLP